MNDQAPYKIHMLLAIWQSSLTAFAFGTLGAHGLGGDWPEGYVMLFLVYFGATMLIWRFARKKFSPEDFE